MVIWHICKLVFHALLLTGALVLYFSDLDFGGMFLWVVWVALAVPMLFRLIPNRRIAIGARKHFSCSYASVDASRVGELHSMTKRMHKGAAFCALGWLAITTAMLFALHLLDMLSPATVLIVALTYAVVDIVFVLFFCPFRTLFMRNQCCTTCRIHNWDYFMKCAPLILFPSAFSISLFAISAAMVVSWEIAIRRNPHYFMRQTNKSLHCGVCLDKLCQFNIKRSVQHGPDMSDK